MADSTDKHRMLVGALNLIPYFQSHPGASLMEAATDLGMGVEEVHEALTSLICSGVGRGTEDLIDLTFSYRDGVTITEDQGLNKPLRLTATEAGALLLTLEALESSPGLADAHAVQSAAAKLRGIMDSKTRGIYDSLADVDPAAEDSQAQMALTRAVDARQRARFDYWSARAEEWTRREVDPARLFLVEDVAYLIAWEPASNAHRTFRIDRMRHVELVEEKSAPHLGQLSFDPTDPFNFRQAERAEVSVDSQATWLAEVADLELSADAEAGADNRGSEGWIPATVPVQSEEWAVRFILGHADRVRVEAPAELRQAVANKAAAGLNRYTH